METTYSSHKKEWVSPRGNKVNSQDLGHMGRSFLVLLKRKEEEEEENIEVDVPRNCGTWTACSSSPLQGKECGCLWNKGQSQRGCLLLVDDRCFVSEEEATQFLLRKIPFFRLFIYFC